MQKTTTTALDIENHNALLNYLRAAGHINASEQPRFSNLAGGVSNRTVLVERSNGAAWVLKQALAKLRVQVDWFSDPRRIEREAMGLRVLSTLAPKGAITPLVFEDYAQHLFAMEAVPQPHENWKSRLLRGELKDDLVCQFAQLLGMIHHSASVRCNELAPLFEDRSFFESLRLEAYYEYSAAHCPEAAIFLRALMDDTRARRSTLVHGDYSPKNILVYKGRLVLLDHEVIHWGDPAFDCGFALTHLLSKAHHFKAHRAAFADAAKLFWHEYSASFREHELEKFAVRHTLACLLARVIGRSTLEYFDKSERLRQKTVAAALMRAEPSCVPKLVDAFIAAL